MLVPGELSDPTQCREVANKAIEAFGSIDVLVSNAARQASFDKIKDISAEEWRKPFATKVNPLFQLI